ncbi:MAG TPA: metallophosphoesterase [Actinoplanes sp.]|nr:metallophosphoesterase [Actinoplanes sp.]
MLAVVVFAAVLGSITGLIHLYLWQRLVRDTLRPGRWRRFGGVAAIVLALLVPATLMLARGGAIKLLAWPGYIWLAVMFYLLVVLLALEVPRLALTLWWRYRRPSTSVATSITAAGIAGPAPATDASAAEAPTAESPAAEAPAAEAPAAEAVVGGGGIDRRLLLARGAAIFAGLTAAGITGYGVRTALGPPQLDRVQIPLKRLPRAMDGTRIALVSDIHLGPLTGRDHARRIVDLINSVDADIVAIVGDLVDGDVDELGPGAAALRDIRSRHGAYFVTGNHEYYSGHQQWIDELSHLGVRTLRNERLEIAARGGVLDLAGVNDPGGDAFGDPPDFAKALGGRDPSRPVVLMAHQPLAAFEAAAYGVDLQVSGHTHGGQMAPFNLLIPLQQPVTSGLGTVDGVPVYVTNGAGFWGPPVRVGAPPQLTLLTLHAQ